MASDNGSRCSSKRWRSDSGDNSATMAILRAPTAMPRSCIEWGLPHKNCCDGCVQFADRVGLLIDDQDHDTLMSEALKTRSKQHKQRDKQGLMLWRLKPEAMTSKERKQVGKLQRNFIINRGHNPDQPVVSTVTITPSMTPRNRPTNPAHAGHQRGTQIGRAHV